MECYDSNCFSLPTPVPRRKNVSMLETNTQTNQQNEIEKLNFFHEISDTVPQFAYHENYLELINQDSQMVCNSNSSFSSNTMPLPRKPRKMMTQTNNKMSKPFLAEHLNDSIIQETTITPNDYFNKGFNSQTSGSCKTTTATTNLELPIHSLESTNYIFEQKTYLLPKLGFLFENNEQTHSMNKQIQKKEADNQLTLKVNRFAKLERPNVPPPPPPKSSTSFLESFSVKEYNLRNDRNDSTNSSCCISSNNSSQFSTPRLSSTPQNGKPLRGHLTDSFSHFDPVCNLIGDCNKLAHINIDFYKNNNNSETFKKESIDNLFSQSTYLSPLNPFSLNDHRPEIGFRNVHYINSQPLQKANLSHSFSLSSAINVKVNKFFHLLFKLKTNLKLNFKKYLFNLLVNLFAFILFLTCICSIILFQTQVHQFYQRFLDTNSFGKNSSLLKIDLKTNNNLSRTSQLDQQDRFGNQSLNLTSESSMNEEIYYTAGSNLIKQTVLFCNGPYFSYQINNLIILPLSLFLVVVFSFFSERESCCINKSILTCGSKRPGLPATVNPFQRRNRFLIAALFCIIANEIFKMIESSMFDSSMKNKPSFNSTSELLNSILANNWKNGKPISDPKNSSFNVKNSASHLNTDFLRVGLGMQLDLANRANTNTKNSGPEAQNSLRTTKSGQFTTTRLSLVLAPSVLRYSKPKLPPRLNAKDFETTSTSNTAQTRDSRKQSSDDLLNKANYLFKNSNFDEADETLTLAIIDGVNTFKKTRNKTYDILDSFNRTLNGSSSKTLFEFSMSLYQNEYVQKAFMTLFKTHGFKWTIITEKLEKLAIMTLEVLVIGMRYYPLLGVLEKNSFICILLASIYMWIDIFYNIAITGMCEGLKLNVSFDLLKDIRRIFGVGFILDAKDYIELESKTNLNMGGDDLRDNQQNPVDTKLLFSTNRIIYTIVKSLPHFFCLSYVTIKLTATTLLGVYTKCYNFYVRISEKKAKTQFNQNLRQTDSNFIVDFKSAPKNSQFKLIYSKKRSISYNLKKSVAEPNTYEQIELPDLLYDRLTFEQRYVRDLFNKNQSLKRHGQLDDSSNSENQNQNSLFRNFFIIKCFTWIFDKSFRFSTRVVCTYTVCFTVLYYLTCFLIFYGSILIDMIYLPVTYKYSIVFSACVTTLICLVQLVLSMKQFKLHLNSLYKGVADQYISPKSFFSNKKIATSSFNYAGYAVTYTCWGYLFLFVILTFISFQIATLLVFGNSTTIGIFTIVIFLPFAISVLIIRLINKFIGSIAAKFCFLQRKSKVLALKNIRFYSLFLYFKFFYDCFTGVAFCLIRMLKSIVLGILFMPRLDYSFMGRTLEKMDSAFMSYIGYLHWESHHTNPIAICFCELLKKTLDDSTTDLNECQKRRRRIVNKWKLSYSLIKNFNLISYRRRKRI